MAEKAPAGNISAFSALSAGQKKTQREEKVPAEIADMAEKAAAGNISAFSALSAGHKRINQREL